MPPPLTSSRAEGTVALAWSPRQPAAGPAPIAAVTDHGGPGGNCADAPRRVFLPGMTSNPTREVLLHLLSIDQVPTNDVDALIALAEVAVGQMDAGPQDFDAAIALAHQHLADMRSELIEAGRRHFAD